MNLNKQIKAYRKNLGLSQEQLAQKVYVSRQTVSNWETGRSYPDVENLMLLSVLFDVSLDELVKGDLSEMKRTVDRHQYRWWAYLTMITMLLVPVLLAASLTFWSVPVTLAVNGIAIAVMLVASIRMEQIKKRYQTQTYSEILAFMTDHQPDDPALRPTIRRWADKKLVVVAGSLMGFVGLFFYGCVGL